MKSEFATVHVVRANGRRSTRENDSKVGAEARSSSEQRSAQSKSIYVAWINYQRRAESMQEYFGYDLFYLSSRHHAPISKLVSYLLRAKTTVQIVLRERPDVVWLQLPPTFLMHLIVLLRLIMRRKMKIVADCHNAALRPPWNGVPLSSRLLNHSNLVLVHNEDVVQTAHGLGVSERRVRVLGDCVPTLPASEDETDHKSKPVIVMPCSFHADEPIEVVLQAARQFDSATFVITGDHLKIRNRALVDQVTDNVVFPGFLPLVEFDRLLLRASAVLCLTTQEGIQLSAVSEAIAAGKPMVISDTRLLRSLFGYAGIFVDNSVGSVLQGCRIAIDRYAE